MAHDSNGFVTLIDLLGKIAVTDMTTTLSTGLALGKLPLRIPKLGMYNANYSRR